MTCRLALVAAIFGLMALASPSFAQTPYRDLHCYDVKDLRKDLPGIASMEIKPLDLARFPLERQCSLVRPKPKMLCVAAQTTPTEPTQARNLRNGFLCYQIKCPAFFGNRTVTGSDRLGAGSFEIKTKSSKRTLCLPMPNKEFPAP